VLAELGGDGLDGPDEHAGIPGEVSLAEEGFGEFRVGLFAEADDLDGLVGELYFAEVSRFATLDVAVRRAGPGGLDADGDEAVCSLGGGEGVGEDALEGGGVLDELVGGEDGHDGIGITRGDEADAEGDGGRGVTLGGLGEDVLRREHVGDLADAFFLEGVGEDEDIFLWDEAVEPGDGLLEEGRVVEEIEELLGFGVSAEGPEAGSTSSGEN